jgi:hypothetical protein
MIVVVISRQLGAAGSLLPEARRLPPDQKERAGEAGIQARHRSLTSLIHTRVPDLHSFHPDPFFLG